MTFTTGIRRAKLTVFSLTILFSSAVTASPPVVFWCSGPIEPGMTAMVAGADFGNHPRVTLRRLADSPDASSSLPAVVVTPSQASDISLTFPLPEGVQGIFSLTIETADGRWTGNLNAPEVYWSQGDLGRDSSPAGWLRLMGRNIAQGSGTRLDLLDGNGQQVSRLTPTAAGPWDATFALPASLKAGHYRYALWSGQGDSTTLARGTFDVRVQPVLPNQTIDLVTFGAKGDGQTDDSIALDRALAHLAETGGGTLNIPAGTYLLSHEVSLPPFVRLRGEDRDLVVLMLKDQEQPPTVFLHGKHDFAIENLTILALNHWHLIEGGFDDSSGATGNITIDNVTIRASFYRRYIKPELVQQRYLKSIATPGNAPDAIRLHGANLRVTNSDIQSSVRPLVIVEGSDVVVADNRFLNGRRGWYAVSNSERVVFENNVIEGVDLQASGGGINTLTRIDRPLATRNILFKGNRSRLHNGGDGEAMTTDSPGGCYEGPITIDANTASVNLDAPKTLAVDCLAGGLIVVAGRGVGQYAGIVAIDRGKLILDRPLAVASNAATRAIIVPIQENILMVDNSAEDAGLALQSFGASANVIIADNRSFRTGGFSVWAGRYGSYPQVNLYAQILNNELKSGFLSSLTQYGSATGYIKIYAPNQHLETFPLVRSVVVRGNRLLGNASILIGSTNALPTVISDIVVEDNTIDNARTGISITPGARNVLLRGNRFSRVEFPFVYRSRNSIYRNGVVDDDRN